MVTVHKDQAVPRLRERHDRGGAPGRQAGARPRRSVQRVRPLRGAVSDNSSTTAGKASRSCRPSRPLSSEHPKTILTRNNSPDISFDRSINPIAAASMAAAIATHRPTHAYMGLSPGLDFETKLFTKLNAPELLRGELSDPAYQPQTIALGANTDPYQPIERQYRLTRQILEVLAEFNHPVGIVTKSALVVRDLDILQEMAKKRLVKVAVSVTTLDPKLARAMEPRAATPASGSKRWGCLPLPASPPPSWWRRSSRPSMTARSRRSWPPPMLSARARPAMCCCACRSK